MTGSPFENARKVVEALAPADQLRLVAEVVFRLKLNVCRPPELRIPESRSLAGKWSYFCC